MPSPDYSTISSRSIKSQSDSYDKIIAIVSDNSSDTSIMGRSNRISVSLVNQNKFNTVLHNSTDEQYQQSAGADISTIFAPFKTSIEPTESGFPRFHNNTRPISLVESGIISSIDLLPFEWDKTQTTVLTDRTVQPSGDGLNSLVSSSKVYVDIDRFRDISDIRGIGLRLPIMGVGWGYTRDVIPMPSGNNATNFKGNHQQGWTVDPKDYIAAPIDFRYDRSRHVWTSSMVRILEGQIVAAPTGTPEFTDNRYWVQPQRHRQTVSGSGNAIWNPEKDTSPEWNNEPLVVTNISEQDEGTHGIPIGQYVSFYELTNIRRDSGAKPITFYIMSEVGDKPAPQYMFMVYQGVASNEPGWDFVRAHPTL